MSGKHQYDIVVVMPNGPAFRAPVRRKLDVATALDYSTLSSGISIFELTWHDDAGRVYKFEGVGLAFAIVPRDLAQIAPPEELRKAA